MGVESMPAEARPTSAAPVDPAVPEDLAVAYRILADQGVLDAFGHVSVRHPADPKRYLLARNLAPELVTAADIMEFDLDSNPVDAQGRRVFLERFIHGEIYKARADVNAVVHTHSPSVVPFGVTGHAFRPVFHMSAFLWPGVPNFDIRKETGAFTDMLVRDRKIGRALVKVLGDRPMALMRGHGNVVVAPDLKLAVYRAVYAEVNARLQLQAKMLGGPITFLDPEEGRKAEATNASTVDRPWELWRKKAMAKR
jgi:HCOMODA/2-hydroxy-3-carboxy-muconic semialdehyde decarboxylase